ncbi:NUDIX domain-containing protein [Microbacterium sp. XT11]|uniref:NUDIX domain-containing protein n=1 Tax=Microbacterium sp. XT11 TaxID=367477 RepID=UPI00082C6BA0|nr:NUDIX domain-containing protein [Microbacterium sp. XT11]
MRVDVDAVMRGLKGFQRDSVDHVIDRFYGPDAGSGRFLVADETGLGKSVIARGVIAKTIERLERDDAVERIDIVYICSNADLANQNLRRLNVTGDKHLAMATRLTLLARESHRLAEHDGDGKKVNLVSFTPGTSFKDGGWRSGNAEERALLCILLEHLLHPDDGEKRAMRRLFQGGVAKLSNFEWRISRMREQLGKAGPDARIAEEFSALITADGTLSRFLRLRDRVREHGTKPTTGELWHETAEVTAALRRNLAKAGVEALEPDLIILDEFQRFRALLDPSTDSEAAELADSLFTYGDAKVLLLSATPYKPFTTADDGDDDHQRDFLETIDFLAGRDAALVGDVKEALEAHRLALVTGGDASSTAASVRRALLRYMSRSERPPLARNRDMVIDRPLDGGVPSAVEIADWIALHRLDQHLGARIDIEQWKSIPYFATFMDTYKAGTRVRELLNAEGGEAVAPLLSGARGLTAEQVEQRAEIDLGNGMLRALAAETIGRGWWKMLWMPPSMPYLRPGPVYSSIGDEVTKHVVFSAWNGVPTAIAALLSHEATRLSHRGRSRSSDSSAIRLAWSLNEEGRPTQMSALALFWPHPGLASAADPLAAARAAGGAVDASFASAAVPSEGDAAEPSSAFFAFPGATPVGVEPSRLAALIGGEPDDESDAGSRFAEYLDAASAAIGAEPSGHPDLGRLAAHAPGSIAYRALRAAASPEATDIGLWRAAWELSLAFRSLFARPESAALLDTLNETDAPYWSVVLDYCADGNLQAVLDEYVFQLRSEAGGALLDDEGLMVAAQQIGAAVRMRAAAAFGHETTAARSAIRFPTRFAVRYGGSGTDADEKVAARQSGVRAAFNSPFAPFVLASTSVGQEGIDFHWWSHAVVHWNLPSNPVDFEQREGRVHRYMGHAVRKNVAAKHWGDVLASSGSAWDAAFAAAESEATDQFSPWWVYDGEARIHRRIAAFTLSRDHDKYERLLDALTLYRLTLGQPRQEDMLRLMRQNGVEAEDAGVGRGAIDLRAPRTVRVVGAVISRDGLVLAAQRGATQRLAGLWEFPGGKVELGESPTHALRREVREELRCDIIVGDRIVTTRHSYPFGTVELTTFHATVEAGEPRATEHSQLRWLGASELVSLPWADADMPTVHFLAASCD